MRLVDRTGGHDEYGLRRPAVLEEQARPFGIHPQGLVVVGATSEEGGDVEHDREVVRQTVELPIGEIADSSRNAVALDPFASAFLREPDDAPDLVVRRQVLAQRLRDPAAGPVTRIFSPLSIRRTSPLSGWNDGRKTEAHTAPLAAAL